MMTAQLYVTTGPADTIVFEYDEITGSTDPAARGIGILGNFTDDIPVTRDTDGDGIADHKDLDSDNDGISDLVESGADASVVDTNGDGVYDNTSGAGALVDANGVATAANGGVTPLDSDGDGLEDYLDLDSDNDGISDTVEAFPTIGFTTNDGDVTDDDTDGDGVIDAFDTTTGHGGDFTTPEDTDSDGTADFLDADSDNDGLDDIVESGQTLSGTDANGDGIDDAVNASYSDPNGDVDDPINDLENNTDNDPTDVDYRSVDLPDKDGDGVADAFDLDDDNDGITDVEEGQIAELVTFSNALDGTTPVNDVIVDAIFFDGVGNVDEQRFDNDNFTFATGATAIPGKNFNFNEDELAVLDAGGQYDLTFDFSGQALVTEVFLHLNSLDSIRFELLAAENPNIGFEVLSGSNFNQLGTNGDLSFGDDDQTTFDTSAGQERQDGVGGGSADGTIRFFSLDGSPITQLDFNLVGQPGRMTTGEGWQLAMEVISSRDTDMDGVADHCDLDSDNDGISDLVESGQDPSVVDVNGDGIHDGPVDPTTGIPLAANGGAGVDPVDSDMDGINDYLDLDSDDDGIPDIVESQPTDTYVALTGFDTDGDGVDDAFDNTAGFGGDFAPVENTDGTDTPDFLDTDSDNDGLIDSVESGLTLTGVDANGDGIDDGVNASYLDPDGDVNDPTVDLDNEGGDTSEVAYREVIADLVTVKTLLSGDSTPDEGDLVTFQIEVTNNGGAQATNVDLSDLLPAGLTATANNGTISQGTYDSTTGLFEIGTLNNGASATLTLQGTVDVGQGGMTITNMTTAATGDQPDLSTVGDDLEESVTVNNIADLVTVKTLASGDSTPDEGDIVTFQILVTNNGVAQATSVNLTDLLPDGLTATGVNGNVTQGSYDPVSGLFDIGTLNQGATATLTLQGTVDVGEGGNTITNVTTAAEGDQTDPSTVGDELEAEVVVNNIADLVTVKTLTSGDSTPNEGDTVTFQIVVTNNGVAQATSVSLEDLLPTGLTATGFNGTITQGSYDAVLGLFDIGTLAQGATATLTLQGTVDAGQGGMTITNMTTAATGDQTDPSTDGDDLEEEVTINNIADLVTVKTLTSGDSTPDEGDTVTFQIVVTNDGVAQATSVSLEDLLPVGLTATGNNGIVTQGSYDAVSGLFDIGTLAQGASATLTLEGTVDVGQGGNTITNMTTAAAGDQTDPSTAGDDLEETVVVNNIADLVTVKTLTSGDSTPNEGDTVTFQIVVTNNGIAQATSVSLEDLLPTGLTATGFNGTITQGSYDAVSGLFDIGTLAQGASATLTLQGTVDVGQGGMTITNVTTAAEGDQTDPSTDGDDLEEAVTVNNAADLVTVKTLASGDSTPDEGDIVTFQIVVTNNGVAQATSVNLTDFLPDGLTATGVNGNVTQGSYDPVSGLFDIGTLNQGATATLTLQGTVDVGEGGNTITNVTTAAEGDQTDPSTVGDELEAEVVVNNIADLVTVKTLTSGDSTPDEGDTVTFQIEIVNNGAATATSVVLTDLLPPGLTPTAFNGGASQGSYDPATGLFEIGTLAPGGVATLTLQGTVDVGEGGNTITNTTTAAAGDQTDPSTVGDDLEEAVTVNDAADLVTVKTLASADATPAEGDSVTFEIEVFNNGAAQATNVSLTDSLPTGITFTSKHECLQGDFLRCSHWNIGPSERSTMERLR